MIALLDSTGTIVVKYAYDAWGNCKALNANGVEITDTVRIGYLLFVFCAYLELTLTCSESSKLKKFYFTGRNYETIDSKKNSHRQSRVSCPLYLLFAFLAFGVF